MQDQANEKKKHRLLKAVAIFLGLLILLLVFLPSLLSSSAAQKQILNIAKGKVPVEFDVEDWKLSWGSAMSVSGVSFTVPGGSQVSTIERIDLSEGILSALRNKNLGTITLTAPHIVVPLPDSREATGSSSETPTDPKPKDPSAAEEPQAGAGEKQDIKLPDLKLTLEIKDGQISLEEPKTNSLRPLLQDLQLRFDYQGPDSPLEYSFAAKEAEGGGQLSQQARITFPSGLKLDPKKIGHEQKLSINHLNITPFIELAGGTTDLPTGEGLISLSLNTDGSLAEGLHFDGRMVAKDLSFTGGALGEDHPRFDQISLDFDGNQKGDRLNLSMLNLDSPVLVVASNSSFDKTGSGELRFTLRSELDQIFNRFPHTLKLREGMRITSGVFEARAQIAGAADLQSATGNARISGLKGVLKGSEVQMQQPTVVNFDATRTGENFHVNKLTVNAGFAEGSAEGNPDDFKGSLRIQIPEALAEVSKFIDLDQWNAQGLAQLRVDTKQLDTTPRKLTTTLELNGFSLKHPELVNIRKQNMNFNLTASIDASSDNPTAYIPSASIAYQGDMGRGRFLIQDFNQAKDGQKLPSFKLKLGGQILLHEVMDLLAGTSNSPENIELSGKLAYSGGISIAGDKIELQELNLTTTAFQFMQDKTFLRQDRIELEASGMVDLDQKSFHGNKLLLTMDAGKADSSRLEIEDWTDLTRVKASCSAQFDFDRIMVMLQPPDAPKKLTQLHGLVEASVDIHPGTRADASGQTIQAQVVINNFAISAENKTDIAEPKIQFNLQALYEPTLDRIVLPELAFSSSPIELASKQVELTELSGRQNLLMEGDLILDMDRIAEYIKQQSGQEVVMTGKEAHPFKLQTPFKSTEGSSILSKAFLDTTFTTTQLDLLGVEIRDISVPFALSNSMARVAIDAQANQGLVHFQPMFSLDPAAQHITHEPEQLILDKVQLTGKMANELLGKIHPLFHGSQVSEGAISLQLAHLNIPMSDAWQSESTFAGKIFLHEVKLQSSGILTSVLDMIKVDEREIDLGDREIDFICKDGRIWTSPLDIDIDEYQLVMSGTVGLDQTLDYKTSVPLTPGLVGKDVARYVEGTSFDIPITGTLGHPRLDPRLISKAVKDSAKKAAGSAIEQKAVDLLKDLF